MADAVKHRRDSTAGRRKLVAPLFIVNKQAGLEGAKADRLREGSPLDGAQWRREQWGRRRWQVRRRVDHRFAADAPDGRSLELWFVRDGNSQKSLGIMKAGFTTRSLPSDLDSRDLSGSVFAVSVEPLGGSPTGGPTGPVIYTGKLIPNPRFQGK